ncbi:MAG TPA: ABC transporter ATP-binding protein [Stellaceae bacterium]|nr:ABC transporter ATP-binding protein [Stellaceae bacterium]
MALAEGAISVETIGTGKRFGDLVALDDVSVRVEPGSVHALLGENGAGKSTLVKCIMGYYRPDSGSVLVDGREMDIASPRQAHALGLGMVYQHFTLVPHMTVLENLVMARADVPMVIDWTAERRRLAEFMRGMPFTVPLEEPVHGLAAGEKQKAEIFKQLYLGSRFLILDEPTSVLTPNEADEILGMMRDMAHAGRITVLIITHKFREVTAFADEVSILRRGRYIGGGETAALTADAMAGMMIGDQDIRPMSGRDAKPAGRLRLELDDVTANDDEGLPAVRGVTLTVRSGEIVGLAGVSGNGQSELVQVLAGQRDSHAGEIRIEGEVYRARRAEMLRHHIAILPEEPLRNACIPRMSVADNMAFRRFDQPPYAAGPWLKRGMFRRTAQRLIERYRVKTPSPDAPIASLSGGNVQRAVLARELSGDVDVLIAANPVFGLDFAAVADIHAQIMTARNRGAAVLLVSEDLDELLELSDRLVVMFDGQIVHETTPGQADLTAIGRYMAGH